MSNEKDINPPKETEEVIQPSMGAEIANDKLTENSISTEAIDFEDSSFLEKNKHAGKKPSVEEEPSDEDEENDVDEYERSFVEKELEKVIEEDDLTPEEAMDKVIREIADQPFEVAMNNLEVDKQDVINAAAGVFSAKGYFEDDFDLPFGGSVTMRSKTVNDYVDYTEYVRRLLLDPISQKEFDTFTQMRNMAYAIVAIDGDDISGLSTEERFEMLRNMSEIKITAIINNTKSFWRITHLLLHPGLVDFLVSTPEE